MAPTPTSSNGKSRKHPRPEEPSDDEGSPMHDDLEKTPTRPRKIKRGSKEEQAKVFFEMMGSTLGLATHRQAQMTFSKSVVLNALFASMCIITIQFVVVGTKTLKSIQGYNLSDVLGVLRFITEELLEGAEPTQIWRSGFTSSGLRTWLVMGPSSLKLYQTRLRNGLVKLAEGMGLIAHGVDPMASNKIAINWSPVFRFTNLAECAKAIVAQVPGVVSVTNAAIESEGGTLLGFARGVLTVDLSLVQDDGMRSKLSQKDFSTKFYMNEVAYTLSTTHPCTVCGEDEHQTKKCPYVPKLQTADSFLGRILLHRRSLH